MQIFYLNEKGIKYASEICGVKETEINKLNLENNKNFIYLPNEKSGVIKILNFQKDVLIKVEKDDDIDELKKKYNIKDDIEINDLFIANNSQKYVVKPLDTMDKIIKKFGVSKDYLISRNKLKTEKLFIGQILII